MRDLGLHVRVLGEGPRSVLLLHGIAGSERYFGAAFDRLARCARVVVPDLLGFGASPRPEDAAYDALAHARAVLGVLQRLGPAGELLIVGHSAGTLVALELAAQLSGPLAGEGLGVRGVIAVSPPLYRDPADAARHVTALGWQARLFASDGALAHAACRWMCRHRELAAEIAVWLRRDLPGPIARDGVQHSWSSYSRTLRNLILEGRAVERLRSLRVEVQMIAGGQDRVLDHGFLAELAASSPHVSLCVWDGGHELPLLCAERLVQRIEETLQALDAP